VLDKTLVDAAADAGAEVRKRFSVQGILNDGDRVCGIEGQSVDGRTVREYARIMVGADRRRSRVARLVGAPSYNARPALTFGYYSYWSGVDLDGLELRWWGTACIAWGMSSYRTECAIYAQATGHGWARVLDGNSHDAMPAIAPHCPVAPIVVRTPAVRLQCRHAIRIKAEHGPPPPVHRPDWRPAGAFRAPSARHIGQAAVSRRPALRGSMAAPNAAERSAASHPDQAPRAP
jgi:hypothetical protein